MCLGPDGNSTKTFELETDFFRRSVESYTEGTSREFPFKRDGNLEFTYVSNVLM